MTEKNLENIITEILDRSEPIVNGRKNVRAIGRMAADRRRTYSVRPRKRRPQRNPLLTSLRLIILGLVILLVPLLFSVKKAQPPSPMVTGAIDATAPYDA